MVTAVYSGTFDPFHWGHLEVVKQALDHASEVVLVINPIASHKTPSSFAHRMRIAQLLLGGLARVRVCEDTDQLRAAFAANDKQRVMYAATNIQDPSRLADVMGQDQANQMNPQYYCGQQLFYVIRDAAEPDPRTTLLQRGVPPQCIKHIGDNSGNFSSTLIKEALASLSPSEKSSATLSVIDRMRTVGFRSKQTKYVYEHKLYGVGNQVHGAGGEGCCDNYECAVDFGGSATKLAFRRVGQPGWSQLEPVPNHQIWSNPTAAAARLTEILVRAGAGRIEALGISMSGIVNREQLITDSDRLRQLNPAAYNQLFGAQGGFDLRGAFEGRLLEGSSVGVANDGAAAALGVAVHPNDSTAHGPVLVVTLGSNPAISIVQMCGRRIEVFPPHVTNFSNVVVGTGNGPVALHAQGGVRRDDLEQMEVGRKSKRIGRAVAAVLSDPNHGYLSKYHYLPVGGIYLMGGLSIGLDNDLLQQELLANLSAEVWAEWKRLITQTFGSFRDLVGTHYQNGPPYALTFGSYEDQSSVHLNGALHYARHSSNVTIHGTSR